MAAAKRSGAGAVAGGAPRRGDRRERILTTAAALFRTRGYHGTSIDDIGRSMGTTGPAVYRHFASKDALLAEVATRGVRRLGEGFDQAVEAPGPPIDRLEALVRAGAVAVIDHLDDIVVYLRERRHLPAGLRRPIRAIARRNNDLFIATVRAVRPSLTRQHVGFMLQSMSGLYLCIAHFTPKVSRPRLEDVLTTMGTGALLGAPELPIDADRRRRPVPAVRTVERASRRETLLTAATALFRTHGFAGVGIDEIATAAGIAGPGVYRHFRSKEDLLAAAMSRAGEQLAAGATRALDHAGASESLDRLVSSYVDIAVANDDSIAVYLSEARALTDARRRAVRRDQRAYIEEWVMVVARMDPTRPHDDIRAAVHAAIGLINGYAEGQIRPPPDVVRAMLTEMTIAALRAYRAFPVR